MLPNRTRTVMGEGGGGKFHRKGDGKRNCSRLVIGTAFGRNKGEASEFGSRATRRKKLDRGTKNSQVQRGKEKVQDILLGRGKKSKMSGQN